MHFFEKNISKFKFILAQRTLFFILIAVFSQICYSNSPAQNLPRGFYRIETIEPNAKIHDLTPIGEMIANANFVAIGEPVHTSHGFYQAKCRLIKYLIEYKGFRTIAFEDNWSSLFIANQYLLEGSGTAKNALLNFSHHVWHDKAILDLLEWTRNYNLEHPQAPVGIYGFDIQDPKESIIYLKKALSANNKHTNLNNQLLNWYDKMDQSQIQDDKVCDNSLFKNLSSLDPELSEDFPYFKLAVLTIKNSCLREYQTNINKKIILRDKGMAEALLEMHDLEAPTTKTIIWAANGHVNKLPSTNSMGSYLTKTLGDNYKTIFLIAKTYDTHLNWSRIFPSQKKPPENSLEEWFSSFGEKYLFINFHQVPSETFGLKENDPALPVYTTDGIFYLDHSPKMTLISYKERKR